ncbi:aldo/keto reductase [Thermodesulfobacteriota bacterium]
MEYRQLGNSGLKVSSLGLGGNNFGWWADEQASESVLKTALDQGINFLDTANVYGEGRSEEWIGRAIKGVRSQVIVATKFGFFAGAGPNDRGGSRKHIMQCVEGSLRRLNTDYIDLLQMHFPDPLTPLGETLRALDDLISAGKIRYIGCSNFAAWQLTEALWTAKLHDFNAFVSIQSPYNLLNRQIEQSIIPCCLKYGIGVVTYTPLAAGFLTGKYLEDQNVPPETRLAKVPNWQAFAMTPERFDTVNRLTAFASERGHEVSDLAVAWLLARPAVSTVIAGATKPEQVLKNVKAVQWKLSPLEVAEMDRITGAYIGIGKDGEGSTKAVCPWCEQQTAVRIPDGMVIIKTYRVEKFPVKPPEDPFLSIETCHACLAQFCLNLENCN